MCSLVLLSIKGNKMKNVYIEKLTTDDTQCDYSTNLPITEIMRLAEIAAFKHADMIGLDHQTMEKTSNAFWVLSKMKLLLKSNISSNEKLRIKTWTHDPGLIRFDRDVTIKSGNTVKAKISSEWCCLDMSTHRIRKANSVNYPDLEMVETSAVKAEYSNLKLDVTEKDYVFTKTVRATDIDVNRHTNNLKYNFMALDSFSLAELESFEIKEYEIYFVNESHEGDKIDVYKKTVKGGYYIEGKVADKIVFRSVLKVKKK